MGLKQAMPPGVAAEEGVEAVGHGKDWVFSFHPIRGGPFFHPVKSLPKNFRFQFGNRKNHGGVRGYQKKL
jgi:hypothetical protein